MQLAPLSDVVTSCWIVLSLVVAPCLSKTCYNCIYIGSSSSDPGIQSALGEMATWHPTNQQCEVFPYHQSNSIQTLDCYSLNYSSFGGGLNGMPYTGWNCGKEDYTMTLKNYGTGVSVDVPITLRGCAPIQSGNPYDEKHCWDMVTDDTVPYIMASLTQLYWPQYNVGMVPGTLTGTACLCGGNKCNEATTTITCGQTSGVVTLLVSLSLAVVFARR